jgi:outer membrane protein OmpA-like peptidoglycan-associated protein
MRSGVVAIVVVVLVIAGCAGTGGTTAQTPAVEAKSDAVAGEAQSAAVGPPAPAFSSAPKPVTSPPPRAVESAVPATPTAPTAYKKNRTASAIVVAVGGGLSNGAVGPYMESYKQDLHKSLQQEIRTGIARVDKLPHNVVRIQVSARLVFDADSSSIKPGFCTTMDKLADVVVRYGKTTVTVVVYPDGKASAKRSQKLPQQRALSVARYLESKEVDPVRLATFGKSGLGAVDGNGADSERRLSRTLEIVVEPVLAKRVNS